jgi:hypothetical protein
MVRESDPKADKIKQRKARKSDSRRMTKNTMGAVKLFLRTRDAVQPAPPVDEDCEHCLKIQRSRIAA